MFAIIRADVEDLDHPSLAQHFEPYRPRLPDPAAPGERGAGLR